MVGKLTFSIFFIMFFLFGFASGERNFLQKEADRINLAHSLIINFSDLQFPGYKNRDFWDNLPFEIRNKYIKDAEEALKYNWPAVKATDYLELVRSGDRRDKVFGTPRSVLVSLIMGELTEGKGRFTDQIVNGVWFYCEQTWWGWSAHLYLQKIYQGLPDVNDLTIDLGVSEVANILSWAWFLFKDEFDRIHPLIAQRLKTEVVKKAIVPYYQRNDFWWQGFDGNRPVNNWNPWINFNMLTAILILEDNQEKKTAGVEKVVASLDHFLNTYPDDGGCDEGPSYWGRAGASLFQSLYLLNKATRGQFNLFNNQLIKNIGSYIYKVYIEYPYFVNFADADATAGSRADIIFEFGKSTGNLTMQKFGAFLAKKQNWGKQAPVGKVDEQIFHLERMKEVEDFQAEDILIGDFWLPDIEVAGARDQAGSNDGFFFAAKGGHNAESHNHNDIGSCVVYYKGTPCIIDIGRETYTAKTFSSQRYDIWTMQSQFHNLPKINGMDQQNGREFKAAQTSFRSDKRQVIFSTDISMAYPENAAIRKWERSYCLQRGKRFLITDSYELKEISDTTSVNVILYCKVNIVKPGIIRLTGYNNEYNLGMKYNPEILTPIVEFYNVTDEGLKRFWPNGVTRIVFTMNLSSKKGESTISISPL